MERPARDGRHFSAKRVGHLMHIPSHVIPIHK